MDSISKHESHVADMLGLADLRIGRHTCRDDSGARVGEMWLPCFWTIRAMPTFHEHVFITVVEMQGRETPRFSTKGWRKAVIFAGGECAALTNVPKNVEPCFGNLQLLVASDRITLDGIGYELSVNSTEFRGRFSFSNPCKSDLVSLANECRNLGDSLAKQSGNPTLLRHMAEWKTYAEDA